MRRKDLAPAGPVASRQPVPRSRFPFQDEAGMVTVAWRLPLEP